MITRGFQGRRSQSESKRLPPGQHQTRDFPVLSAGPTPQTPLNAWTFALEDPPSPFVMAFCDGGYTTNLPVEDLLQGKALVVWEYDGEPLAPAHGGPARLLVPHLYFW